MKINFFFLQNYYLLRKPDPMNAFNNDRAGYSYSDAHWLAYTTASMMQRAATSTTVYFLHSSGSRQHPVVSSCKQSDKPLGSQKCSEFLE